MTTLKIISYSDSKGGAAKAARNFFQLLLEQNRDNVELLSAFGLRDRVKFTRASKPQIFLHFSKMIVSRVIMKFGLSDTLTKNSLNIFSSLFVKNNLKACNSKNTILHLNWVNNETISLHYLKKLTQNKNFKIILTLHDEWLYCATEHYADYSSKEYLNGYINSEKLKDYIYNLKMQVDFSHIFITVPSSWLKDRAQNSLLLKDKDVYLLPNYIDTEFFYPFKKDKHRILSNFKLNVDAPIFIGFGAVGGGDNPHKGFDLLIEALENIDTKYRNRIVIITFGSDKTDPRVLKVGCHVVNLGKLYQREQIRDAYNSMDIMIVPSRVESFGQVAAESLACQTPVVAFEYSGITDIVSHKKSGYLAKPFDAKDLAAGIISLIDIGENERVRYGVVGRQHIVDNFGKINVAQKYLELISKVEGFIHE